MYLQALFCSLQAKAVLEKTKNTLEAENQDLASDLKQVQMAKQESERKRKQQDAQISETTIKLAELERSKTDASERNVKLQVRNRHRYRNLFFVKYGNQ